MKETEIYSYYAFGFNYQYLKRGVEGKTNQEVYDDVTRLYLDEIKGLELQVTLQVISELNEIVDELALLPEEDKIDIETARKIKEILEKSDATLDAELQLRKVLYVTPKRFNQAMLLTEPYKLLAKNSWFLMPPNAQVDFASATSCIAMNQSTAAAFHLMRSVEEMVKQLYFSYVKQKRMAKPMWGPIIQKLMTKNNPKPEAVLIESLDMIRKNYRNPTQHPDKYYNIDEAQDLLHHSIVAINMITADIRTRA
ncbi:hypothetical protein RB977_002594 [Vibrio harveyi]|nr:hypothetical protein [Vibrio harveyi]